MAQARNISGLSWLTGLIGIALVMLLAFLVIRIVITVTNPESVWTSPAIAAASPTQASAGSQQSFTFSTDPFNRAGLVDVVAVEEEIGLDAPETTLNLTLTGLITGPNGNANLRTPDGKERGYRIGDEVINGVTLQAIHKDYIVISVDGQLQRLTFARAEETVLGRKSDEASKAPTTLQVSVKDGAGGASRPNVRNGQRGPSDIGSMFQNISLKRVVKNGQLAGYSVRPNRPGVKLDQFGFEKGDIVTAIAGTDVTKGRPDFVGLMAKAQTQGAVEISVLRNGQTEIIRLGAP